MNPQKNEAVEWLLLNNQMPLKGFTLGGLKAPEIGNKCAYMTFARISPIIDPRVAVTTQNPA